MAATSGRASARALQNPAYRPADTSHATLRALREAAKRGNLVPRARHRPAAGARMHETHDALVGDGFSIVAYRDLPRAYQLALAWHFAVDGEAWEEGGGLAAGDVPLQAPSGFDAVPERDRRGAWEEDRRARKADLRRRLEAALPEIVAGHGDEMFGVALVPASAAKAHVMAGVELRGDWGDDWEAYHRWYLGLGGIPDHPRAGRWPCLVSDLDFEAFDDGWHRFHAYCAAGDADIPLVFRPEARHFAMRGVASDAPEGPAPPPGPR